ncbi:MAG: D-alanyl-D-alanine carboxypeptidase/D-alanyl-D-alanine-endopeptidase [Propionicimonas sp.]|nr:D-alanyl-D-alanine carboxypeptidase/D-alanyl-D-alanine-endopeptidase [Propionicimonas sp.]
MVGRTDAARSLAATLAALVLAVAAGCSTAPPAPLVSSGSSPAAPPNSAAPPAEPAAPTPTPSVVAPPVPVAEVLADELAGVSRKGIKSSGVVVVDPSTGTTLASRGDAALVPASTMKVLTSLAVVDTLGADATFTTRVVSSREGRLVLVGGGDPMLTDKQSKSATRKASLAALAETTVAALERAGTTSVRLGYDDSLFSGPAWHPSWKSSWRSYTARVSALSINGGRSGQWSVHPDPALTAAKAFAARLKAAGIKVTAVKPAEAAAGAVTLAEVVSAPLSKIVGHTLRNSDNFVAEVLAHQVALANGEKGSFAGGAAAVTAWLQAHDLWADDMVIDDGSGLSSRSRVRPSVLVGAISLALVTPRLASVPAGFPVAGVNGTLKDRFDDTSEKAGRKVVHAKTGTLLGVASLAGYVTTADGATLAFAAMANKAAGRDTAYNWLDRTATVLARCGCRTEG